jgi:hypothetical protein
MIIMGHPQFEAQDDVGIGDGIAPIPEWQLDSTTLQDDLFELSSIDDYGVKDVFIRLRNVFKRAEQIPLPATRLHDLTCFVIHRLLLPSSDQQPQVSPNTECLRCAIILYMFITQGPTYFSHAVILNTVVTRFMQHLDQLELISRVYDSLDIWILAIGMVASSGTGHYQLFMERAQAMAHSLQLRKWNDAFIRIKSIMWLETLQGEDIFRPPWESVFAAANSETLTEFTLCASPSSTEYFL